MPSSLHDIPGINPEGRRGRARRRGRGLGLGRGRGLGAGLRGPRQSGSLDFGPTSLRLDSADRSGRRRLRWLRRLDLGALFAWVLGVGTLVLVGVLAYRGTRVHVDQTDLEDGAALNALELQAVDVRITFRSPEDAEEAELRFDGEVVEEPTIEGEVMRWRPPAELEEGEHSLELSVPRVLLSSAHLEWEFTVDRTPPAIEIGDAVAEAVPVDEPAALTGKVERGAKLTVAGREAEVDGDGRFRVEFSRPPAGPLTIEAVDRAGNTATASAVLPVRYPGMRGVFVTAAGWSDSRVRSDVLRLLDERRIDTVVLDLKDDQGVVGFDTDVARAHQIGAVNAYVALDDAVATVRQHGGRLVGRITTFKDVKLANAAWTEGHGDQVIQQAGGRQYGAYTNFAHPEVQRYNLDIALDAIDLGVQDIMWDEVRRPGDDPTNVVVPGLNGSASDALLGFLGRTQAELRRRGAFQGVAVMGWSADRGDLVSQDVAQMARRADYLVPTIHPAYWDPNDFGVPSPIHQPGDLVNRVLTRFKAVTEGSGTRLAPSLQDFSAKGVNYGPGEVRAQIDNARAVGVDRFILWDTGSTYTAEALDPQADG